MPSLALRYRLTPITLALLAFSTGTMAQSDARAVETLKEVTVRSKYEREDLPVRAPGNKAASGARLGILGATAIVDAPVHVNAYTRELAEDWSALTLQDVLENDSAVVFTTNKNHLLQNFNLRGLDMNAIDIATNGLYGIAPANAVPVEMFERIEVLRGPNVLLSGMPPASSVAGTVNMVTKRALAEPVADLTMTYGSRSYLQAHADVGKRFGAEKRLGLRFNGVYGSGEMGAKEQEQSRRVAALALDYLGDRARFSLDWYSSVNQIENGSPGMFNFLGVKSNPTTTIRGVGRLLAPPRGDINMYRGTQGQYDNSGGLARAEFDLTSNLQGYVALGGSQSEGRGLLFGTRSVVVAPNGDTKTAIYNVHIQSERSTAEAGLIGSFDAGGVKHRLQLTTNLLKLKEGSYNTACSYCQSSNMFNPSTPKFPSAPAWKGYTTENDFRSFALADTMAFAGEKVLLTVGGRHQNVKTPRVSGKASDYSESRFSPMVAAVVRPWGDSVSLFGNYTEGLEPGEVVGVGYANTGESLAPRVTKQAEVGMKVQAGMLTHTVSGYQIQRPSFITNAHNERVADGDQRLRGLEWSVFGMLTKEVTLLGGVTHIQSEQRNTGLDTFGTPQWRARVGVEWQTPVQGLKLGARMIHTGSQWADSGNKLRIASWSRLDLHSSYVTQWGALPVRLNASMENVADKQYWIGTFGDGFVMAGAPRTFKLAATLSF